MTPRRRLALLLAALFVPWVALAGESIGLVFAWGIVDPGSAHVVTLSTYLGHTGGLFGLPRRLVAWPVSVGCYLVAVASALAGLRGLEDERVTAGLLALAGVNQLVFALGLDRGNTVSLPLGAVALLGLAAVIGRDVRAGLFEA